MPHAILLAEDDSTVRAILSRALEGAGYRVCEAANGREAMRALDREPFDAVVTDIIMPDADGIETILYVRRRAPHTRVIAITGLNAELHLGSAASLGAHRVMEKPFPPSGLVRTLADLLAEPRAAETRA